MHESKDNPLRGIFIKQGEGQCVRKGYKNYSRQPQTYGHDTQVAMIHLASCFVSKRKISLITKARCILYAAP